MADKWIQLMSEDGTDNLFPTSNMDLLWTNSSPTSSFAAQTVSLDLSDYNLFVVVCRNTNTGGLYINNLLINNSPTDQKIMSLIANGSVFRTVTVSDSGMTFGAGKVNTTTETESNTNAIPIRIYGIR